MANQKNRGGQEQGKQQLKQSERKQGPTTQATGQRSARDKRADRMSNPDDRKRQPTNQQR
jgi:hypothetical protein